MLVQAQAARRAQPSHGLVPGCDAQAPAVTHDGAGESAAPRQPAAMLVDSMAAFIMLSWSTSMVEGDSLSTCYCDTENTDKVW